MSRPRNLSPVPSYSLIDSYLIKRAMVLSPRRAMPSESSPLFRAAREGDTVTGAAAAPWRGVPPAVFHESWLTSLALDCMIFCCAFTICCNPPLLETLNADADFTDGNASGIICLVRVLMPRNWIEDQPPNAVVGKCLVPIITADVGNDVRMVSLASMFWSTIAPICSPISPQMKLSCNDFSPLVFVWKPWRCLCLGCVLQYMYRVFPRFTA